MMFESEEWKIADLPLTKNSIWYQNSHDLLKNPTLLKYNAGLQKIVICKYFMSLTAAFASLNKVSLWSCITSKRQTIYLWSKI